MAKKKTQIPKYGTITLKGIQYYRTRITDADGKELSLYAATCEELYEKQLEARKQVEEIIFHRQHPTVAEYGEKWLLMQSAKVSASTLRGYTRDMTNYIIKPLGEMYMEEVTADDIRLALVPLSKKSEGLYNKVNMLLKCIFYAAERNQILEHNPCAGISGKGGKPTKKKEALTDQQVAVLLDTVKPKTDNEVRQRVNEYFEYCQASSLRPGVETLRTALHVSRSTLYEWSQGRNCSSERAEIIQGAKSIIDSFLEQAMLSGKVNPATGIFYCKNWLGYHDSISLEESLPMTSTQEALRAEDLPKLGAEE